VVAVAVLVVGAGILGYFLLQHKHESPTATRQSAAPPGSNAPPLTEGALEGLLLTRQQTETAVGGTLSVTNSRNNMVEPRPYSDEACDYLTPSDTLTYANTGWTAVRAQAFYNPGEANRPGVWSTYQAVVLFPSAHDAWAFFDSSAQHWAACSNRQVPVRGHDVTVGPVSNTNGTLRDTSTGGDETAQRALSVANNVVIDVVALGKTPLPPDAAVNIARQIANKVPT
jgi:serine/threonine-protein kinase